MRGKQKLSRRRPAPAIKTTRTRRTGGEREQKSGQDPHQLKHLSLRDAGTGVQGSMGPDPATPPAGSTAASVSSSLIFLGTGCSGALPDTRCLIRPGTPPCHVCSMGLSLPPDQNPNYRCERQRILASIDMELLHLATEFIFTEYKESVRCVSP